MDEKLKIVFEDKKRTYPGMSLDELLYSVYNEMGQKDVSFDSVRPNILAANGINELEYYTRDVNQELKDYIEESIFPQNEVIDKAHGIIHIKEVIRRAFALNDTFKLGLDPNMIYAMAAYHDLGKHENHTIHEKIAASKFILDYRMQDFFTHEQREIIRAAIEDHRSSKEDEPRTIYGKLISSADRNTRIDMVFIRSFFVAHERMPNEVIDDYLVYTLKRLSKKYDENDPENMFFEDETYKIFIDDMRALLKKEDEFKNRYCAVNNISSRQNKVKDEAGVEFEL